MWVVEINIVGLRFVHHPRRVRLAFSPRGLAWRTTPQRPPRVA